MSVSRNEGEEINMRERLGLKPDAKIILLTGGAREVKDQTFALDALGQLLLTHLDHIFIRIGPILDPKYYE